MELFSIGHRKITYMMKSTRNFPSSCDLNGSIENIENIAAMEILAIFTVFFTPSVPQRVNNDARLACLAREIN